VVGSKRKRSWVAAFAAMLIIGVGIHWARRAHDQRAYDASFQDLGESAAVSTIREMGHGAGVTAVEGRHMHDLIVAHGYKRGLDVGTAHGYSALWFALALRRNGGSLVTVEIDPDTAKIARANFKRADLDAVVDLRINDAFKEIPRLDGDFDCVFLDTGTSDNQRFLGMLAPRIRPGGAIMAHNATFMRWQQPDYWRTVTTRPEYRTTVFERVAITLKR
jgi:predicted O-methyltransferase YrrM